MAIKLHTGGGFGSWTLEFKVWHILTALILLPMLVMFVLVATYFDEALVISRNEIVSDAQGLRDWHGTLLNPSDSAYREIAVTIRFLDAQDQPVGETRGQIEQLLPGESLSLEGALPETAVRMQVYSLQWRTGRRNVGRLFGPYKPWEFAYVQYDPAE